MKTIQSREVRAAAALALADADGFEYLGQDILADKANPRAVAWVKKADAILKAIKPLLNIERC